MSLETVIQKNTDALLSLIGVLTSQGIGIPPVPAPAPPPPPPAESAQPASITPQPAQGEVQTQPATLPAGGDIDYSEVKAAILKMSLASGKDATLAILAKYNVTSGLNLRKDQYGPVIADIRAALGEDEP